DLATEFVFGMVPGRTGRTEHGHRTRNLGERSEPLDELGLDAQHSPRIRMNPAGRPTGIEQPLVRGGFLRLAASAQDDWATVSFRRTVVTVVDVARHLGHIGQRRFTRTTVNEAPPRRGEFPPLGPAPVWCGPESDRQARS